MSETKDTDRPAGGAGRKTLALGKGQGSGTVRQSFSHGRSKAVVVEKKNRRRVVSPKDKATGGDGKRELSAEEKVAKQLGLSVEEVRRRKAAMEAAKAQQAEREAKKKAEDAARSKRAEDEKRALEEERERKVEEQKRKDAEAAAAEAAAVAAAAEAAARPAPASRAKGDKPAPRVSAPSVEIQPGPPPEEGDRPRSSRGAGKSNLEELGGRIKSKRAGAPGAPAPTRGKPAEDRGRRRKLTITSALDDEGGERQRSIAALKRAREKERQRRVDGGGEREKIVREVVVPEAITVQELANRMAERVADIVKYLMKQGQMVRAIDSLDADTAELIVEEFGHTVKRVSESDVEDGFLTSDDPDDTKTPRPPIVTVMGHVDHGKTSLLDALRKTDVVAGEAGGITQHIGAYQVRLASGDRISFLDTPGHAAFSAMRARGATVTDIVILVVAADDSVMPQTIEAINHARAAEVPMIVAVNKCDKPDSTPDKVLQDLLQHEVVVESMGGETQAIKVSALTGAGLDELTEAISLQAELLELKANPDRSAEGVVIESELDTGRGPVATVLVHRGTLKRGDLVVAGGAWGKVRALINERGQQLKEAGPSTPVEILGLSAPPDPGEPFAVVDNEARAREITEYRIRKQREKSAGAPAAAASLEQMMSKLKEKAVEELPVVVKSDVQGSAEALTQAVEKIGNDEVKARVIHQAVGGVW